MNKEEIKYYLMLRQKNPKFYAENEERRKIFLELLEERYPYAIKIFVETPARFIESWGEYRDKNFKLIAPLYVPNQTEKQHKEYYCEVFNNLTDKASVISRLESEFWQLSTLELINFYKRFHKKIKDDKNVKTELREFHGNCLNKINEISKPLDEIKKKAVVYFTEKESRAIKENLLSDVCTEDNKNYTVRLIKKYVKDVYKIEYLRDFLAKYKTIEWLKVYVEIMKESSKDVDYVELVIELLNSPAINNLRNSLVIEMFKKVPDNSIAVLLEKVEKMDVFDELFEHFTMTYNKPNEVVEYSKLYLSKFNTSGEAISNVATHVKNGRSSLNLLPDLIEEHVKKWLLNYNFHNHENEICSVIEALSTVKRLEDLLYDFSFWKKMEKCNAFISLIDSISFIVGFDECFELIEKNYFAAKAYGEESLADKWMQAANAIAIHYEDAQRPFILMFSKMVDQDSILDSRSKGILLKKVLYDMLTQAANNKKRLDLEIHNSKKLKDEFIQDIIFHIYEPLQKLEKTIIGFSNVTVDSDDDTMKILRNMIAKIRQSLKQVGVLPIVDIESWEKRKVIPFDGNLHVCTEDLRKGEPVTCLSMGMKDEKEGFFEKAAVKIHVGEKNNGNNV